MMEPRSTIGGDRIKLGYPSDRDRLDGDHDLESGESALGLIECDFPFPFRMLKVLATNESLTTAAAPKSNLPNRLLNHTSHVGQ